MLGGTISVPVYKKKSRFGKKIRMCEYESIVFGYTNVAKVCLKDVSLEYLVLSLKIRLWLIRFVNWSFKQHLINLESIINIFLFTFRHGIETKN